MTEKSRLPDKDVFLSSGKIHKRKRRKFYGGYEVTTLCGIRLSFWSSKDKVLIPKELLRFLPQAIRCKKCYGISIPMKKRSLDYILGITKK